MTIEQQIAALTTATTDLLDVVKVKKATLDTAVSDASSAAAAAITAKEAAQQAYVNAQQASVDAADASRLSIGTVTTATPGSSAQATITGTAGSQSLNLTIPAGLKGDKGDKGDTGPQGVKGDTGATGPQGIQGIPGNYGKSVEMNVSATALQFRKEGDPAWTDLTLLEEIGEAGLAKFGYTTLLPVGPGAINTLKTPGRYVRPDPGNYNHEIYEIIPLPNGDVFQLRYVCWTKPGEVEVYSRQLSDNPDDTSPWIKHNQEVTLDYLGAASGHDLSMLTIQVNALSTTVTGLNTQVGNISAALDAINGA